MAHIGVSVSDDTKAKWEGYIENSDYGSMSELVRSSVKKEIRRESGENAVPQQVEKQLDEVAATQNNLQVQMEDLAEGFEDVVDSTDQYPKEIVELAHDIAGELEEVPPRHIEEPKSKVKDELWKLAENQSRDVGIGEVADALDYLEENLSYIERVPQGPSDYYRVRGRNEVGRDA